MKKKHSVNFSFIAILLFFLVSLTYGQQYKEFDSLDGAHKTVLKDIDKNFIHTYYNSDLKQYASQYEIHTSGVWIPVKENEDLNSLAVLKRIKNAAEYVQQYHNNISKVEKKDEKNFSKNIFFLTRNKLNKSSLKNFEKIGYQHKNNLFESNVSNQIITPEKNVRGVVSLGDVNFDNIKLPNQQGLDQELWKEFLKIVPDLEKEKGNLIKKVEDNDTKTASLYTKEERSIAQFKTKIKADVKVRFFLVLIAGVSAVSFSAQTITLESMAAPTTAAFLSALIQHLGLPEKREDGTETFSFAKLLYGKWVNQINLESLERALRIAVNQGRITQYAANLILLKAKLNNLLGKIIDFPVLSSIQRVMVLDYIYTTIVHLVGLGVGYFFVSFKELMDPDFQKILLLFLSIGVTGQTVVEDILSKIYSQVKYLVNGEMSPAAKAMFNSGMILGSFVWATNLAFKNAELLPSGIAGENVLNIIFALLGGGMYVELVRNQLSEKAELAGKISPGVNLFIKMTAFTKGLHKNFEMIFLKPINSLVGAVEMTSGGKTWKVLGRFSDKLMHKMFESNSRKIGQACFKALSEKPPVYKEIEP